MTTRCEWSPDGLYGSSMGLSDFVSEDAVPSGKMYLLLNLAVGGSWPGAPDAQTKFPAVLAVDYVRVYQKAW